VRCRECGSTENPFSYNPCHKNSGVCKPCKSKAIGNYQKLKKALKSPHLWFQCDDCEQIFSIYFKGSKPVYGHRKLKTFCPYCSSEEILTFAEQLGKTN